MFAAADHVTIKSSINHHNCPGTKRSCSNSSVNTGCSQAFKNEADETAVTILQRVGSGGQGLIHMLRVMQKNIKPGGIDCAKTHPSPTERFENISSILKTKSGAPDPSGYNGLKLPEK